MRQCETTRTMQIRWRNRRVKALVGARAQELKLAPPAAPAFLAPPSCQLLRFLLFPTDRPISRLVFSTGRAISRLAYEIIEGSMGEATGFGKQCAPPAPLLTIYGQKGSGRRDPSAPPRTRERSPPSPAAALAGLSAFVAGRAGQPGPRSARGPAELRRRDAGT